MFSLNTDNEKMPLVKSIHNLKVNLGINENILLEITIDLHTISNLWKKILYIVPMRDNPRIIKYLGYILIVKRMYGQH